MESYLSKRGLLIKEGTTGGDNDYAGEFVSEESTAGTGCGDGLNEERQELVLWDESACRNGYKRGVHSVVGTSAAEHDSTLLNPIICLKQ